MWDNIGRKLQGLAKFVCWIGIISSIITAIVLWTQNNSYQPTILAGFLYLIIGCLLSWIGSWAMYALGLVAEHVENGGSISTSVYMNSNNSSSETGAYLSSNNYWVCPKCKNRNPRSKVECKECGTLRP